jgi:hypothetical protein
MNLNILFSMCTCVLNAASLGRASKVVSVSSINIINIISSHTSTRWRPLELQEPATGSSWMENSTLDPPQNSSRMDKVSDKQGNRH